jgi:hypothetical protein
MKKLKKLPLLLGLCLAGFCLTGCTDSTSSSSTESNSSAHCEEPSNPYSDGTAEYKGYEWAQEHGRSCNASSSEFTEGCEDYDSQEAEYEECQAKKGQ